MLGRAALALLLMAAPASAERWRATYTVSAAGVILLDAEVRFTLGPVGTPYNIETRTRTRGVAAMLLRADSQARSEGMLRQGAAAPSRYESDGNWRGTPRRTVLEYRPDGMVRVTTQEPAQDMERTPVPDADRRGTIDSLSALVLLTSHVRETARCEVQARTFDGRRLTQFDVTTDPVIHASDRGLLRCIVESRPLAGFPTDRPLEEATRPTRTVAVFGVAQAGAPAIPIRIDIASRWWGAIQANLVELTSAN